MSQSDKYTRRSPMSFHRATIHASALAILWLQKIVTHKYRMGASEIRDRTELAPFRRVNAGWRPLLKFRRSCVKGRKAGIGGRFISRVTNHSPGPPFHCSLNIFL